MKKAIISLALAFLGIANLYAVKAKPGHRQDYAG